MLTKSTQNALILVRSAGTLNGYGQLLTGLNSFRILIALLRLTIADPTRLLCQKCALP